MPWLSNVSHVQEWTKEHILTQYFMFAWLTGGAHIIVTRFPHHSLAMCPMCNKGPGNIYLHLIFYACLIDWLATWLLFFTWLQNHQLSDVRKYLPSYTLLQCHIPQDMNLQKHYCECHTSHFSSLIMALYVMYDSYTVLSSGKSDYLLQLLQ